MFSIITCTIQSISKPHLSAVSTIENKLMETNCLMITPNVIKTEWQSIHNPLTNNNICYAQKNLEANGLHILPWPMSVFAWYLFKWNLCSMFKLCLKCFIWIWIILWILNQGWSLKNVWFSFYPWCVQSELVRTVLKHRDLQRLYIRMWRPFH